MDLSSLRFFAGVPPEQLEPLQAVSRLRRCPARHVVFRQGDASEHTWIVLSGAVKLTAVTPEGAEVTLDHLREGDCFGIVGVVGPLPRQSTARTTRPSELLEMPTRDLQRLMEQRPALFSHVLRQLVSRLAHSDQEKVVLASQRVYGRLALKLLALSRPTEDGRRLPAHFSHAELAGLIGSTRATVTRAFGELRRQGIVEADEEGIVIRREEELREMIDWYGDQSEGTVMP